MSSCNSVSQDVEERPIDDDLVGRNSWRGTFFLFPLVCDMGFIFLSLSLSLYFTTPRSWNQTASDEFVTPTHHSNNKHLVRKAFYEKLERDSELDRRSLK